MWIDQMDATIGGIGVNGLAGVPTAPESGHMALFIAKGSWPFALPVNGRTATLQANFAYRRGGGIVEATLSTQDSVTAAVIDVHGLGFRLKLTPGDTEYRLLKPVNRHPIQQAIPLAQFCKLSSQGRVVIEPFDTWATDRAEPSSAADLHEPPITIDVKTVEGMSGLFDEACAPLVLVAVKN
jgi:hypothetical protein